MFPEFCEIYAAFCSAVTSMYRSAEVLEIDKIRDATERGV